MMVKTTYQFTCTVKGKYPNGEYTDQKITITSTGDHSIDDLQQLFQQFIKACGFYPEESD